MQYKKTIFHLLFFALGVAAFLFTQACGNQAQKTTNNDAGQNTKSDTIKLDPYSPEGHLWAQARNIFGVLPDKMPGSDYDTQAMIDLGKMLYFETAMSINDTQSCNDCHPIDSGRVGADNRKTGLGALGKNGPRNDPPTLNAGYQIAQFWDGRAPTLKDQAGGPPLNPIEMGMPDSAALVSKIGGLDKYKTAFKAAFPGQDNPVTMENLTASIAAFERTLITTGRLDDYIAGDVKALTKKEKAGLKTFIDASCIQCHNGPNLGGLMYQKMGVYHPYANTKDVGRLEVTGNEVDKYHFKVPMLRNVLHSSPYFHDGAIDNLGDVIDQMAYLQLDKKLSNDEIKSIMKFFASLSDKKIFESQYKDDSELGAWKHPDTALIKSQPNADEIKYGYTLLTETSTHPDTRAYVGNALACTSCHQNEGTKKYGLPYIGVTKSYPQYRGRENREVSLAERINGCFERSMNGKPIPEDGKEMKAMIAYMDFLSRDAVKDQKGMTVPKFEGPDRRADVNAGQDVFTRYCQSCHGADGQGYTAMASTNGTMTVPALWGNKSYNNGAGTARLLTAAPFIQSNMPLGVHWNNPFLTDDQAYDVAAYVNSHPRPQMAGLEKDYPDLSKKPVDCPYPPYTDSFSQDQHTYGPFQEIKAAKEKK